MFWCSVASIILEFKLPLEVLLDLLQPIQADLSLQVNLRPLQIVSNFSSCQKTWVLKKPKSLACLEVELLLEVLLDLLQPIQAVLSLQVNLRPLEIVSNDSPYTKTWVKKNMSLACLEVKLLLEVLLDLLQPIQAVLSLQVNLRPLEMVSNDSPCQKNWV